MIPKCDEKDYNKEVQAELIPVLKFIGEFIKEYGLINLVLQPIICL